MLYFTAVTVFILGTLIGSFLNVVILRSNTGLSIFSPKERSRCFSCGKVLGARELIPILSFLFLRGRCAGCGSKISWQYPLVEFTTGLVFLLILFKNLPLFSASLSQFFSAIIFHFAISSVLIVITFYDLKHKIIPNGPVYGFIVLSFLWAAWSFWLVNLLAGVLFFTFFFLLWFFSKGKWIGLGDAKLALGIGFFLGLAQGVSALILAFWIGAAVSVFLLGVAAFFKNSRLRIIRSGRLSFLGKNLTMKSEIPFAPFLILGTLIVFFWGYDALGLMNLF